MHSVETSTQPIGTYLRLYVDSDSDASLLEKYRRSETHQEEVLQTLDTELAKRPDQRESLAVLHQLIWERVSWERKLLSIYEKHDMAQVVAINADGTERSLITAKIQRQLNEMEAREAAILRAEGETYSLYKMLYF